MNVGAGRAVVVVPEDVTVKVDARATIGDITLPVSRPGGAPQAGKAREVDVNPAQRERRTLPPPPGSRPAGTVELTLEVGIGQVEVTRAAS